jgi:hypothetical protein
MPPRTGGQARRIRRIVALLVAIGALGLPPVAEASGAKLQEVVFAKGASPAREHWSASAGVVRRHGKWMFGVNFNFSRGFKWGSGQEIPIGTHKQMAGQADGYTGILSGDAPESAAFGLAGPEVTTIKMKMSDGSSLAVHPIFPPGRLRHKFVWMRGFRYFMKFYPGGAYVTEYWLYDKAGKRVGCETYAEGELGPSVCGTAPIVN